MLIAFVLGLTALINYYVVFPIFLNPLIKQGIPGPWHYKLTRFFILNITRREKRLETLQKLHEKYGPVVMVGPNEVSLNSLDLVKKVYLGNYPKEFKNSDGTVKGFYSQFGNYGETNMFTIGENREHLQQKRQLQKLYSNSSIKCSQAFIRAKVLEVVKKIEIIGYGKNVEVGSLFTSLAMDVVSGFNYGSKLSSTFVNDLAHTAVDLNLSENLFSSFRATTSMWFYTTLMPSLWAPVARLYGIDKRAELGAQWIYDNFAKGMDLLVAEESVDVAQFPLNSVIAKMWETASEKRYHNGPEKIDLTSGVPPFNYKVSGMTTRDTNKIASEIADHIVAGHETTGVTLTYIAWELSRPVNFIWREKLRQELRGTRSLICEELENLPVLGAIISESLRLHAAIPGSEPRFVPRGQALKTTVAGCQVEIPEGTIVACQPWTLHRQAVFGANPERFKPARWLQQPEEPEQEFKQRLKAMHSNMFVFGEGNRMCLGMHLALAEIRMVTAAIYSRFETTVSPDWCPIIDSDDTPVKLGYGALSTRTRSTDYHKMPDIDKMAMADSYVTRPMFDECWLRFEPFSD
ncbi:LAMI_0A01332g1_1 [Lachancea mirantina]|uniref:LAMI_0A01332g1_1 n=1 Tax=Lachancea mirantina TaxID=1230905 RepID=A0A1G4ILN1_9SACH|nr:LAMI_0A01332g1_1 [Lachancea mirantina]